MTTPAQNDKINCRGVATTISSVSSATSTDGQNIVTYTITPAVGNTFTVKSFNLVLSEDPISGINTWSEGQGND